jgi:hypothetical protein
MTPERNNRIAYTIFTLIIALYVVLLIDTCNHRKIITPPTPRDSIITKIDTLQVHDKVLVEKWHKAIHTTDSITEYVYLTAPDTCDPYIKQVVEAYQNERDSVTAVVNSKDSILTQYKALSKLDSTNIATLQKDTLKLRKQLHRRGKVAFVAGYMLGLGTEVVINKLK